MAASSGSPRKPETALAASKIRTSGFVSSPRPSRSMRKRRPVSISFGPYCRNSSAARPELSPSGWPTGSAGADGPGVAASVCMPRLLEYSSWRWAGAGLPSTHTQNLMVGFDWTDENFWPSLVRLGLFSCPHRVIVRWHRSSAAAWAYTLPIKCVEPKRIGGGPQRMASDLLIAEAAT